MEPVELWSDCRHVIREDRGPIESERKCQRHFCRRKKLFGIVSTITYLRIMKIGEGGVVRQLDQMEFASSRKYQPSTGEKGYRVSRIGLILATRRDNRGVGLARESSVNRTRYRFISTIRQKCGFVRGGDQITIYSAGTGCASAGAATERSIRVRALEF